MKYLALIIVVLLMTLRGAGQDLSAQDVPEKVRKAFEARYPDTYVYEWEYKRKSGFYEAEFMYRGVKHEACFTREGLWISTEKELKISELPKAVSEGLVKTRYGDWKIDEVKEHQSGSSSLVYEIEVKQGKKEVDLFFLPDGSLLRVEK